MDPLNGQKGLSFCPVKGGSGQFMDPVFAITPGPLDPLDPRRSANSGEVRWMGDGV